MTIEFWSLNISLMKVVLKYVYKYLKHLINEEGKINEI